MSKNNEIKTWKLLVFGLIIFLSIILRFYYAIYWPKAVVKINDQTLNVLLAENLKHWEKGLSGRQSLGKYDGMLFVFPDIRQHVFVMRDMKFPLDIIWFKQGLVVDIAQNLPPDLAKTEDKLTPYPARENSDLVLEIPAGFAKKYNLKIGDKIEVLR